jgi:hypothetical protein
MSIKPREITIPHNSQNYTHEELHTSYASANINWALKPRVYGWRGGGKHVVPKREKRNIPYYFGFKTPSK